MVNLRPQNRPTSYSFEGFLWCLWRRVVQAHFVGLPRSSMVVVDSVFAVADPLQLRQWSRPKFHTDGGGGVAVLTADTQQLVEGHSLRQHWFADDTQVYTSAHRRRTRRHSNSRCPSTCIDDSSSTLIRQKCSGAPRVEDKTRFQVRR